jgi:iron complex outermembrane recepter protein
VQKSNTKRDLHVRLTAGVSALALTAALGVGTAYAQDADQIETVTVTGFRASLEKALDMKRAALTSTDSIMAEDVAKFPDMNVSESLQRIPGVTIAREGGEGRQVTVRGLGAQFTRVRINGMEVLATTSGSDATGGTNRGRSFDFNVFASELFSQLTVQKTQSAELQEGSLGATVDLHTAHPFDHAGLVFTTSAQYGYQEMAGSSNPRFAALVSDTFLGGRVGVLVSAAYASNITLSNGSSTVRWYTDGNAESTDSTTLSSAYRFGTVNGTACKTTLTGTDTLTGDCAVANSAFHPRFPRYDILSIHEKRMGFTGSVQWQPDDNTLLTLDAMFADFAQVRNAYSFEANSFSLSGNGTSYSYTDTTTGTSSYVTTLSQHAINLINFDSSDIDSNNNLYRLEATNVGLRTESSLTHLDTRFMQTTLDASHSFSDKLKVHMLMGWSESHYHKPLDINITADLGCKSTAACYTGGAGTASNPYAYDYGVNDKFPYISYGNVDVTSSDGWFLSRISMNQTLISNAFRTAVADAEYKINDIFTVKGGIDYRNFGNGQTSLARSNGTTSSLISSLPNAVRSTSLSSYAQVVNLRGINVPSGTPTAWWAPDIKKAISLFDLNDQTAYSSAWKMGPEPSLSSNGTVNEADYGGWLQLNWQTTLAGMPLSGNVGVRYALTETASSGYTYNSTTKSAQGSVVSQTYHDILPSMNAVLEPMDDFLIRLNASYAVARPDLSKMLPGGTVSGSMTTRTVSITNPLLKPTRSKNVDLSAEWYYGKGALLSFAVFYKHIDSTVQTISSDIVYHNNSYGLSDDLAVAACGNSYGSSCNEYLTWNFSIPKNVKGGALEGTEINWQQPFSFLPHPFNYFGVMANLTLVQAKQNFYNSDGSVRIKDDLEGLSRVSYNTTMYYDDETFQMRLTTAFRSHYAISQSLNNLNNGNFSRGTLNIDASASYKLSESLMLTVDALNLSKQATDLYTDKTAKRRYEYKDTGRVFYAGVKYTY